MEDWRSQATSETQNLQDFEIQYATEAVNYMDLTYPYRQNVKTMVQSLRKGSKHFKAKDGNGGGGADIDDGGNDSGNGDSDDGGNDGGNGDSDDGGNDGGNGQVAGRDSDDIANCGDGAVDNGDIDVGQSDASDNSLSYENVYLSESD